MGGLRLSGDRLQAKLTDFAPDGEYLLTNHMFKNRSLEVVYDFAATGGPYLVALSFLGAARPAVKGLSPRPTMFQANGEPSITVMFEQSNFNQEEQAMDANDLKKTEDSLFSRLTAFFTERKPEASVLLAERVTGLEAQLAEKTSAVTAAEAARSEATAQLAEVTAKLAEAEKKLTDQSQAAALAEFTGNLEALLAAGKINPAEKDLHVSLAETQTPEQRGKVLDLLNARNSAPIFREMTAPDVSSSQAVANPRTAKICKRAEVRLSEVPGDESAKETLAVCQLMEASGNEKLSFAAALTAHRSKK